MTAEAPLSLLCIEPRFPGRLGPVADWLVRKRGYRCLFLCARADGPAHWPRAAGHGLDVVQFKLGGVARQASVPWTATLERGLCHAYAAWEVLHARRPWPLHLVLAHSADLGSSLFAPVDLPAAPVVHFFDYYVRPREHDLALDDADLPADYHAWRRTANAMALLELESGATPWTATAWQRDLFPPEYRPDFFVLHPGIDTANFAPRPTRPRSLAGRPLPEGAKVVTFAARSLDRLRGFDRFARLANRLLAERPDVVCVAAGSPIVQRSLDVRFHGQDYPAHLFAQAPPQAERFWLPGLLPPAALAELLAASDLHVCASRPYPLAHSVLQALASGAVVLAWDSPPVREVLTPNETALLVPPEDEDVAFRQACAVLDAPAAFRHLGEAGAAFVRQHFAQNVTLPRLAELFDHLVAGRR